MRALLLALVLLTKPIPVGSVQLWNEYRADAKAADAKYKHKAVTVTGKIRAISLTYTVYLEGGVGQEDGITSRLTIETLRQAADLAPGQTVTLSCTCEGLVFNEPLLLECNR